MYLILKLKTDRLNTWFGFCGITDVRSSALRPLFCLELYRILSLGGLASYWKYMIVTVKQTDFTDVYFRFYLGHDSWPMLYLFVLWILWSTHIKKDIEVQPALLMYPWYLTRKVFNLEKLNLFNTQNWKGLFWFLSPVLFCFFTELSIAFLATFPYGVKLLDTPSAWAVWVSVARLRQCFLITSWTKSDWKAHLC